MTFENRAKLQPQARGVERTAFAVISFQGSQEFKIGIQWQRESETIYNVFNAYGSEHPIAYTIADIPILRVNPWDSRVVDLGNSNLCGVISRDMDQS